MRKATLMNSFTKGVLDTALRERIDLVHYHNGVRVGDNCGVRPQGGIFRRPGTVAAPGMDFLASGVKRRLRRRLEPVHVSAGMVTLANGGTAANLVSEDNGSGNLFTSNSVSGTPFVLAEIDLGAAIPLAFVDVTGFKCTTGAVADALAVEYSDGVSWFAFDGRRNIRSNAARSRRFGSPPGGPGGAPVTTRYLRFVLYGATGTGAFVISRVRVWREKRLISPARLVMFARARDTRYELVLTDRNIDVFKNHRWVAAIAVPVDASQVMRMTRAQSLDTLVLYNEDVETPVIRREGSDDEWDHQPVVFTNVPTLTPATVFSGDTNEVQELSLAGIVTTQQFRLWIDDEVTAPITFSGTGGLAAAIATAIGALPAVASDPTVTLLDAATRTVRIEFTGDNGARRWAPVLAVVLSDDVLQPVTVIVQRGINADGALASKNTGFPRCGCFWQSRHIFGGFRSAPQTIINSYVGDPFNLLTTGSPLTAAHAFIDTLETDQNETIYHLYAGKHLQAFTESGAWFQESRTQDALQPRNWRIATRPGIQPTVPPAFADDATLFLQSGGRVLQELVLVSNVDAQYQPVPKNLLAPQIITGGNDFAVREPRSTDEASTGYIVNSDGSIAHLMSQKAQENVAFLPWSTDGGFRSVGVDVAGNIWAIIERSTVAGGADLYLERFEASTALDATIVYEFSVPTQTLTGLGHWEGKDNVWAYVDGDLYGPLTVTGGQITLAVAALDVSVGLFAPWSVEPMPIRAKLNEERPFRPPGRIYEMEITVDSAGPLDLAVNDGPTREVPVTYLGVRQRDGGPFQSGGEMDLPLLDRLFTGSILMQNLRGWSRHPRWVLSQSKPSPVQITAVRSELAHKG